MGGVGGEFGAGGHAGTLGTAGSGGDGGEPGAGGNAGTPGTAGSGGDGGGSGAGGEAGGGGGAAGASGAGGAAGQGGTAGVVGSGGESGGGGESGAGGGTDLCSGIDCDDSNPCTDDACDPELGCVYIPATDGTVCAPDAQCAAGACNLCPSLFIINAIPSQIREGDDITTVQTRAQERDGGLPMALTLTLSALWGSFENTENIREANGVVLQNATYICDRPGLVEVCVDASDGACTKTGCDNIICPESVGAP